MDNTSRGEVFRGLHDQGVFVVANAWDEHSARTLTDLGFPALATSSSALALTLGRKDGVNALSRSEVLANAEAIAASTPLPVSADLESGYGTTPDEVAETFRQAIATGLAGGSIEDASGNIDSRIRDFGESVERVAAAAQAVKESPTPFTLTARAENFLYGITDLEDTIARLQAFEAAGADVLYAPGLPDADAIRAVCAALSKPVNVLAAGPITRFSVTELGELGACRISIGGGLARLSGDWLPVAREIAGQGTFGGLR
ncbi:isocitrate lyase/phosphoenolpyruvate mutase family protein [Nocardia sp. NPDC058058]|uniref:isocitrate lyase/PEP mutase family protein n=1 Tax=Nocardia sp. NPDC058058 TaxID=3346317 RepID=UPI0036DCD923